MLSIVFIVLLIPCSAFCEELDDTEDNTENDIVEQLDKDSEMGVIEDIYKTLQDNESDMINIKDDVGNIKDDVKGNKELLEDISKTQQEQKSAPQDTYYEDLLLIHEDIQKLMISLWCLFGFLMGSKLIRGMFGNG